MPLMGSRPQEPEVLREAGNGEDNHTLKRARLLPCSECNSRHQSELAGRLAAVSSAVQDTEGPFYRSPGRQGFHKAHTCVPLFTLLPATPPGRKPVPAGKVVGVILWV